MAARPEWLSVQKEAVMSRSLVSRVAALFILSLLLAAPWSAAEPRQDRGAVPARVLSRLWGHLSILWSDIGCVIDPSGRCGGSPSPSQTDIGCGADPDGRCHAATPSQADIGCILDPSGGCGR
jgi:hypothetical protein